ncbi:MAG: putative lipid II flippase FtsW [Solirubrobacteraceae bacterium]
MPPPLEHRILTTAALCLLAFGAVMVYSASAPLGAVNGGGGTGEFVQYLLVGAIGLGVMRVLERGGVDLLNRHLVKLMMTGAFVCLALVLLPGIGIEAGGARRWLGSSALEFQPSEVMKLALVLWLARYLAEHPNRARSFKPATMPILLRVLPACGLIVLEPDLGTALVIAFTVAAVLLASGMPVRYLGLLGLIGIVGVGAMLMLEPYERARVAVFLNPWAAKANAGFQPVQGQIALGSGGLFGVGLGRSVQKVFYLPEAQTDFILAVIGEELGLVGIFGVVLLYGMIAYAGLRTARRAGTRYAKLLAAGLTSLILCQGILNIFVVLGIAPLTGVPLPFISYAPSNLLVMLASVGLLQNIARPKAQRLRAVDGRDDPRALVRGDSAESRNRRRRDSGTRRAGAGGRRRATGSGR